MQSDLQNIDRSFFIVYLLTCIVACASVLVGQIFITSTIRSEWFLAGAVFSALNLKLFGRIVGALLSGTTSAGGVVLVGLLKTMVVFVVLLFISRMESGALLWAILGYLIFIPASLYIYYGRAGFGRELSRTERDPLESTCLTALLSWSNSYRKEGLKESLDV